MSEQPCTSFKPADRPAPDMMGKARKYVLQNWQQVYASVWPVETNANQRPIADMFADFASSVTAALSSRLAEAEETIKQILQIPYHAYGDNEAAVTMANLCSQYRDKFGFADSQPNNGSFATLESRTP